MKKLNTLLTAVIAIGRLFAPFASAKVRDDKNDKSGFNFLPALCVVCIAAVMTACGGGGGGGGGSAASPTTTPNPPATPYTYRVEYASVAFVPDTPLGLVTLVVGDDYRILRRNDGMSIGAFVPSTVVVPGGSARLATTPSQLGTFQFPLDNSWAGTDGVTVGATVSETVYIADFGNNTCSEIRGTPHRGDSTGVRGHSVYCLNAARATIASVAVLKTHQQIYQLCWRDNSRIVTCSLREDGTGHFIGLAFPDQTYRRDDGECDSAPFYAVGNCQNENAVDVGNFAAFVSGFAG